METVVTSLPKSTQKIFKKFSFYPYANEGFCIKIEGTVYPKIIEFQIRRITHE